MNSLGIGLSSLLLAGTLATGSNVGVEEDQWSPKVRIDVGVTPSSSRPPRPGGSAHSPSARKAASKAPKVDDCAGVAAVPGCLWRPDVTRATRAKPKLTRGHVQRAVRRVGMPRLSLVIQPGGETLVNIPTIFYTQPTVVRRSLTLLGEDVEVMARPTTFTWHHGDGTVRSTSTPGRPFPAKDVTHRYLTPGHNLRARVDTTYTVRYRVNDGAWTDLGTDLTTVGQSTSLDVDEAAPVLVDP